MNTTTDLISELVRAANQVDKVTFFEVGRLLDRAERTITDLRDRVGIVPIKSRDAMLAIQTVAECAAMVSRADWRATLLQAAEMIRDLHIVFDTGMDINIVDRKD